MNKLILFLIFITLIVSNAYAQTAFRLCDKEGDCIEFTADGDITVGGEDEDTDTVGYGPQIRLCDKDGDCLDITSDGELQIE